MKKQIQKIFTLIFTVTIVTAGALLPLSSQARDEVLVSAEKLPASAKAFLKEHFSTQKIVSVVHDKEWLSSTYEVILENRTEVDFSSKGVWQELEAKGGLALPDSVIPAAALAYLRENYSGKQIKSISKKGYGYEIELRNGIELRFDRAGKFIGFDD